LETVDQQRYDRFLPSTTVETMQYVNNIMVFSFISRAIYQFVAVFGLVLLPDVPLSVNTFVLQHFIAGAFFYLIFFHLLSFFAFCSCND
jgi:hypothetical protein